MASHPVTDPRLDPLIQRYVAELAGRLPADAVDELADGLVEAWHHHLDTGVDQIRAAEAAVAEFGSPEEVTAAFVAGAPGRRTARVLLATGPVAGLCWGASLVAARAWTWPIPMATAAAFAVVLAATVAALVTAATSRHGYRRTRLGGAGALALLALDAGMLAAVVVAAPVFVWPMVAAGSLSIFRIAFTLRALPQVLAS